MLIEFSVANFRSIKERQTLSLVASNKETGHPGNIFDCPGLKNTKLVKSAVLYGANASGKSNLLHAVEFMFDCVTGSATVKPDADTGVMPFVLDEGSKSAPTEFEIHFVHEDVRYQYGFSLDAVQIHTEWLTAYPHGRPQRWFSRELDPAKQDYDWSFGPHFSGDKKTLTGVTNKSALFLSTGAHFKHQELAKARNWFHERVRCLDYSSIDLSWFGGLDSSTEGLHSALLCSLLQQADLGIEQIEFRPESVHEDESIPLGASEEMRELLVAFRKLREREIKTGRISGEPGIDIVWHHRGSNGKNHAEFRIDDESRGTLKLLSLLLPLLSSLEQGRTVLIDEIAAYMHPLLVRHLLALVHNPEFNPKGAQWVFSTHDVTLLDTSLFRRDQIWFTEKNRQGATTLYPLSNFKPRKDEALQKGYLAGRYGAIPFFGGEFTF